MKTQHFILILCLALGTALLLSFKESPKHIEESQASASYLSIVGSYTSSTMTVIQSTNGKPFKETSYDNRKSEFDLTPLLNIVVEREKQGWELMSNQMTYDDKNGKVLYMFLMRIKKGK